MICKYLSRENTPHCEVIDPPEQLSLLELAVFCFRDFCECPKYTDHRPTETGPPAEEPIITAKGKVTQRQAQMRD